MGVIVERWTEGRTVRDEWRERDGGINGRTDGRMEGRKEEVVVVDSYSGGGSSSWGGGSSSSSSRSSCSGGGKSCLRSLE